MKRVLIALWLLWAWNACAQPEWIQHGEFVIGENDALEREDVLNRPGKYIWERFLAGHTADGSHDLNAMGAVSLAAFQTHSHSLSALGAASATAFDALTAKYSLWHTATGEHKNPLKLGNGYLKEVSGVLKWSEDNIIYANIGGGAQRYGLESTSTAKTIADASLSDSWYAPDFQVAVFVEHRSTAVQSYFRVENDAYSCTRIDFGIDAAQHLTLSYATNIQKCFTQSVTSILTIESADFGRMIEVALQFDHSGSNITFYRDGEAESHSLSTPADSATYGSETVSLGAGFQGIIGPVRFGVNRLSWPTTGWKSVDYGLESFPGASLVFPLSEGQGSSTIGDVVSSYSLTLGNGISWVDVFY